MIEATPELVRILIRKLDGELVDLRRNPPRDPDSGSGRQHWQTVETLQSQLDGLYRLAELQAKSPRPPAAPRRTWRDIPPVGSWKPEL